MYLGIVRLDNLNGNDCIHIYYFHSVSIKNFMQDVTIQEFFVKYFEEGTADVCGDVFTVRRVVPGDVS